ncbi:DNA uptake protein ComE-like DNA-binding protein [Pedobacter cryoconitis]|uniref:DNA uptake protein ComE-like DNA-binding protein n=1 Tax=Pedobacter cryoconitis TaxID=188932 RepID=A0A7W9DIG4_9SPHI|nr:helix-hairpin-helix domain-containing protein [Pedobacter cryoconitis]MBB5619689.1 DNA uptake protein ComE-like DNA-binding protein [Pedobacter cryoconitis]MBB5647832.1 DNA uptake protein ComE-like DNA-binding protein [Pedobacter cryoconitis]
MQKWLRSYFSFSKREYNGLLAMVVLIVLIRAVPFVYVSFFPEQTDPETERLAINKLMWMKQEKEGAVRQQKMAAAPSLKSTLFNFDPNLINADDWQRLGLSVKQAAVMSRYKEKGGRYFKKEDLQKMYVISPEMYERLIPYISIGLAGEQKHQQLNPEYPAKRYPAQQKAVLIPLNTADTLQLMEIRGVGPAFARRIFNYRQRLGGFYKKEQLLEVYGLDSLKYDEIKDQLSLDEQALTRINLNTALFDDLKNHPYLKYKQVNAIIQFRKQHGNYGNIADLRKVAILSAETIERLAPYISF